MKRTLMINNIKELADEIYITNEAITETDYEYVKAQIESLAKRIWTKEKTISLENAYAEIEKQAVNYLNDIREEFSNIYGGGRADLYAKNNIVRPLLKIIRLIQEDMKQKRNS